MSEQRSFWLSVHAWFPAPMPVEDDEDPHAPPAVAYWRHYYVNAASLAAAKELVRDDVENDNPRAFVDWRDSECEPLEFEALRPELHRLIATKRNEAGILYRSGRMLHADPANEARDEPG